MIGKVRAQKNLGLVIVGWWNCGNVERGLAQMEHMNDCCKYYAKKRKCYKYQSLAPFFKLNIYGSFQIDRFFLL